MPAQPDFQQRLQSIERLLAEIESADPALRTAVQQLVQLVMDLHGSGLERVLQLISATGDGGDRTIQALSRDELVGSLLILHGLHPVDFAERVSQGLLKANSRLRTHEGEVELLSIQEGAVRLRLRANGHGCGSTAQALKEIVTEAVYQTAPDITALVIDGADDNQGFVPLEMLQGIATARPNPNLQAFSAAEKGAL